MLMILYLRVPYPSNFHSTVLIIIKNDSISLHSIVIQALFNCFDNNKKKKLCLITLCLCLPYISKLYSIVLRIIKVMLLHLCVPYQSKL